MNPVKAKGFDAHGWIRHELERMVGAIMEAHRYLGGLGNGHHRYPLRSADSNQVGSLAGLRLSEERLAVFTTTAETLLWYGSQSLNLEQSKKYVTDLMLEVRAEWLSRHNITEEETT